MRVLMICPELPTSDKPGTMAPGARQIRSIQKAGVETHIVDMKGIPKLKYLQTIPRIRREAKQVDLIHAHFGYCGWLALIGRALAGSRIPIVISFMGSDLLGSPINEKADLEPWSVWEVWLNQKIAPRYDQIIVKSSEMAGKIKGLASHVIPNGVDVEAFRPMDRITSCRQIGLDPQQFNVLFPGNPNDPRKGHNLASASVQFAEQKLGAPIKLVPLWEVKPDEVAVYMNACQAMLMTSVFEGSPNVVKEALVCNKSVIGVPVGDVHELLNGVEGCYRVERDPEQIGCALEKVLRLNQSSNGREVLQSRGLSLEGVANRVIAVYQKALLHFSNAEVPA